VGSRFPKGDGSWRRGSRIEDRRDRASILHTVEEMLRLGMFAIVEGYEDADDCDAPRHDPLFKMAMGRVPEMGDPLCSQPTMQLCRLRLSWLAAWPA
jgi:hypothetical protein